MKFDIGGDTPRVVAVNTKIGVLTFKHVLLPVWMTAYKYCGRTFRFVVNGRTRRVQGQRPYSAVEISIVVVFNLIVTEIVGFVMPNSQW